MQMCVVTNKLGNIEDLKTMERKDSRRLLKGVWCAACARCLHEKSGPYKMLAATAKVHQSPLNAPNASKAAPGKC